MYRNCMQNRPCNCGCKENHNECENEYIENSCSNVLNSYNNYDLCSCGFDEDNSFPTNYMYGQSYVPIQRMGKTFIPCAALKMGTIFPELVSPYMPGQSQMEIEYLRKTNSIGEGCNKC